MQSSINWYHPFIWRLIPRYSSQSKRATAAAPITPATPKLAALAMAAPVLVVDVDVAAVPADVPLALEALEELGEVVVGLLPLAALVAAVGPAAREVVFKQDVEDPLLMVNGADWAT